jgi:hypothetical protein
MGTTSTRITTWLPIVGLCPVNKLPDLFYVAVTFEDEFQELYAVRKRIRRIASWRYGFMEDTVAALAHEFPSAVQIELSLLFGRHVIMHSNF